MAEDGREPHFETDAARGASTPNIVRWILLVSLFAAIALLSIIWITGAATQSKEEGAVRVTSTGGESAAEGTDSVVGENADELDTVEPGDESVTPTVENETTGTLVTPVQPEAN